MMRMKMGRTAKWHSGELKSPTAYVGEKISPHNVPLMRI